jgi:hypothetical protein
MRILIDSKDLIDIVEYRRPIAADDFSSWLILYDSELVFTMTNISELAAPLRERNTDILHIRSLLQMAEKLPHAFLREGTIAQEELTSAAIAFLQDGKYETINPYVDRWDSALMPKGDSMARIYVNYRLDEIVFALWRTDPNTLLHSRRHSKLVIGGILSDRALPESVRRTARRNFPFSLRTPQAVLNECFSAGLKSRCCSVTMHPTTMPKSPI